MTIRAIDVCSGAGGWAVAARGLPIRITHAFDRDPDHLATYEYNHPGVTCVQCDVVEHDFSPLAGEVDLVLGGIPCELLSLARGHLQPSEQDFAALYKLIDACLAIPQLVGADWFCYEDVHALEKHLPPLTPRFRLESSEYSPQRRARTYVGNVPMPPGGADNRVLADCLRGGPYRLSARLRGARPRRSNGYSSDRTFYPWFPSDKSPTVVQLSSRHDRQGAVIDDDLVRQLEWQELALLQGFPGEYVFIGSPTKVVKQIGQAVQIDTARAILKALCRKVGLPIYAETDEAKRQIALRSKFLSRAEVLA